MWRPDRRHGPPNSDQILDAQKGEHKSLPTVLHLLPPIPPRFRSSRALYIQYLEESIVALLNRSTRSRRGDNITPETSLGTLGPAETAGGMAGR